MLRDACLRFEQALEAVSAQCKAMLIELDEFERDIVIRPVEIVGKRLLVIACWIAMSVLSRYEEHGGKGHACVVMADEGGLITWWVESKRIVANKREWKAHGFTILSIEETFNTIKGLQNDLPSGMWADVVAWIKRCGL